MRTLNRVEYLGARIEALEEEESAAVEPETNGHPYKEQQERERQQQRPRLLVRDLRHERTRALREASRLWHERRVFLHRQIRVFEGLAQERRDELARLQETKPPLLPAPAPQCETPPPRKKRGRPPKAKREVQMAG